MIACYCNIFKISAIFLKMIYNFSSIEGIIKFVEGEKRGQKIRESKQNTITHNAKENPP